MAKKDKLPARTSKRGEAHPFEKIRVILAMAQKEGTETERALYMAAIAERMSKGELTCAIESLTQAANIAHDLRSLFRAEFEGRDYVPRKSAVGEVAPPLAEQETEEHPPPPAPPPTHNAKTRWATPDGSYPASVKEAKRKPALSVVRTQQPPVVRPITVKAPLPAHPIERAKEVLKSVTVTGRSSTLHAPPPDPDDKMDLVAGLSEPDATRPPRTPWPSTFHTTSTDDERQSRGGVIHHAERGKY